MTPVLSAFSIRFSSSHPLNVSHWTQTVSEARREEDSSGSWDDFQSSQEELPSALTAPDRLTSVNDKDFGFLCSIGGYHYTSGEFSFAFVHTLNHWEVPDVQPWHCCSCNVRGVGGYRGTNSHLLLMSRPCIQNSSPGSVVPKHFGLVAPLIYRPLAVAPLARRGHWSHCHQRQDLDTPPQPSHLSPPTKYP